MSETGNGMSLNCRMVATPVLLSAVALLSLIMFLPSPDIMVRDFRISYDAMARAISGYLAFTAIFRFVRDHRQTSDASFVSALTGRLHGSSETESLPAKWASASTSTVHLPARTYCRVASVKG